MAQAWTTFPHANAAFDYAGDALAGNWDRLHKGDQEPFPSADWVAGVLAANAAASSGNDAAAIASALQDAWRSYHRGDFQAAVQQGENLGAIGSAVANKAEMIYATYLVDDEKGKLAHFQSIIDRAEAAKAVMPQHANHYYFQAYAQGRYSQEINIAQALAQGIAGKVKTNVDKALTLAPQHAEAHLALAAYHAEVIDKVGSMVGGLTYGAKKDTALEHFESAQQLLPFSAIARLEYGSGLLMLFGNKKMKDVQKLYAEAATCEPKDAMEAFDVAFAKSEVEG